MVCVLCGIELLDNWAGLEDRVSTGHFEGELNLVYLELGAELLEAHVVNIDIVHSLDMFVIMARVCKADKKCKADSRANNAPTGERHVYICP